MVSVKITLSVAKYVLKESRRFIQHGWGNPNSSLDDTELGVIDELSPDTNASRYLNALLHFVRFVAGLLDAAINEAEQEQFDAEASFLTEGEI